MEDIMLHHHCLEETERTALVITKKEEDNNMATSPFDMRKPPVMVEGYTADDLHMEEEDNDVESEYKLKNHILSCIPPLMIVIVK
eukprot:4165931-Ditylum_brightwellii.AAC.1